MTITRVTISTGVNFSPLHYCCLLLYNCGYSQRLFYASCRGGNSHGNVEFPPSKKGKGRGGERRRRGRTSGNSLFPLPPGARSLEYRLSAVIKVMLTRCRKSSSDRHCLASLEQPSHCSLEHRTHNSLAQVNRVLCFSVKSSSIVTNSLPTQNYVLHLVSEILLHKT